MSPSICGIDVAKHSFSIHSENNKSNTLIYKQYLEESYSHSLPTCLLLLSGWKPVQVNQCMARERLAWPSIKLPTSGEAAVKAPSIYVVNNDNR